MKTEIMSQTAGIADPHSFAVPEVRERRAGTQPEKLVLALQRNRRDHSIIRLTQRRCNACPLSGRGQIVSALQAGIRAQDGPGDRNVVAFASNQIERRGRSRSRSDRQSGRLTECGTKHVAHDNRIKSGVVELSAWNNQIGVDLSGQVSSVEPPLIGCGRVGGGDECERCAGVQRDRLTLRLEGDARRRVAGN